MAVQDRTITLGGYVFDEKEHLHTLDGKPLTGVTTVLRVIGKGDVLVNWAANCAVDYIIENGLKSHLEDYQGEKQVDTVTVTEKILKEARTAHTKKKERAGDWGTNVHSQVEEYINRMISESSGIASSEPEFDRPVSLFINWAIENKVKFLASEKHVYSKRMWIGGIADIICEIDGKRYVGDIKTSKGIYPEAFIQCSAYAGCLAEMKSDEKGIECSPRDMFDGVVIINLKKDGGFDVQFNYDLQGNLECFEAALKIYRHMNAITK